MNKSTSLYLDLVRALAALMVFLSHARFPFFSQGQNWLPNFGHEMVVIFFVLSGFVIAYAASKKDHTWQEFASDRLSRLYSVVIPALLLTAVLDFVGQHFSPGTYASEVRSDHYGVRMVLAGLYLNQSWAFAIKAGSNSPLWSLAYEFWYYFLFGGCIYARRGWKLAFIAIFIAMTGYKIPLLLPAWLVGVGCYYICQQRRIPAAAAAPVAIISLVWVLLVLSGVSHLPGHIENWNPEAPLFFSGKFVSDILLSLLVGANFVAVDAMLRRRPTPNPKGWGSQVIRYFAGRSFALYVFHFPVLVFCKAIIPFDGSKPLHVASVLLLALAGILALSEITEQKREPWRRLFRILLGLSADRPPKASANATAAHAAQA
jgi:peptidoglycan/LPS O-acetylase OafA/YrhL